MSMGMWRCTLAATALIALVLGSRSSFGLLVSPINTATGIGLASIGLAVAFGQLAQGLAQPVVGWLADRHGAARVIGFGALGYAAGNALTALAADAVTFGMVTVLTAASGTAMSSIAVLLAEVGRRVPAARQSLAIGIVGAGGSLGQLLLGPATQAVTSTAGWDTALRATAALAFLAMPLALVFRRPATRAFDAAASTHATLPTGAGVREALRRPAFWLVAGGFGACGLHVSFLTMHMPGVIERCGLPVSLSGTWLAILGVANIAGSIGVGLVLKRRAPATVLVTLHALRALFILALLSLPPTPVVMLGFAAAMGLTYMAVLPPTSMLVTRQFGARHAGTLFGFVMLVHQMGSFAGVWLGAIAADAEDPAAGYLAFWLLDVSLALLAAAAYLPFALASRPRSLASVACSVPGSIGLRMSSSTPLRRSASAPNSAASPV
jgi:predicted MFS family arabinose efflux permease